MQGSKTLLLFAGLIATGMLFQAGMAGTGHISPSQFRLRLVFYALLNIGAFLAGKKCSGGQLKKHSYLLFAVSGFIVFCAILSMFRGLSFMPSVTINSVYLMTILAVPAIARWLASNPLHSAWRLWIGIACFFFLPLCASIIMVYFGMAIIAALLVSLMMFFTRETRRKILIPLFALSLLLFVGITSRLIYGEWRMMPLGQLPCFPGDPESYELYRASLCFYKWELIGGSKMLAYMLPQGRNAFIVPAILGQWGAACLTGVGILYLSLFLRICRGFLRSKDLFQKYLSGGIAILLGLLAIGQVSSATGLIAAGGIPIPFISIQGIESAVLAYLIGFASRE